MSLPLLLRGVSLFHVALPIIWIAMLLRWGYDRHAFWAQTLLLWVTLIVTFALTDPEENINWVFMPEETGWPMPELAWLVVYMITVPFVIHWPLHKLYSRYLSIADAIICVFLEVVLWLSRVAEQTRSRRELDQWSDGSQAVQLRDSLSN